MARYTFLNGEMIAEINFIYNFTKSPKYLPQSPRLLSFFNEQCRKLGTVTIDFDKDYGETLMLVCSCYLTKLALEGAIRWRIDVHRQNQVSVASINCVSLLLSSYDDLKISYTLELIETILTVLSRNPQGIFMESYARIAPIVDLGQILIMALVEDIIYFPIEKIIGINKN